MLNASLYGLAVPDQLTIMIDGRYRALLRYKCVSGGPWLLRRVYSRPSVMHRHRS